MFSNPPYHYLDLFTFFVDNEEKKVFAFLDDAVFDCDKPFYPCGKKDANFGSNADSKCFCLPYEFG